MSTVLSRLRNGAIVAGAAVAIAGLSSAPALAWKPTKEVKLVIHTAGATSDINNFVREVEKILDPKLPEGADAMNMPGGGGDRARRYVLSKKGDPNVLQGVTPSNISRPILNNANYRATDFTPIAIMVASPLLVVVNAKSPYKSFKDIIDAAKKNPGKVVQGGGAVGEVDSLYNAMIANEAHVKIPFTPFKSKGITELLGRHIDLIMCNPAQADPYVKSGDFRVIATNMPVPLYPKRRPCNRSVISSRHCANTAASGRRPAFRRSPGVLDCGAEEGRRQQGLQELCRQARHAQPLRRRRRYGEDDQGGAGHLHEALQRVASDAVAHPASNQRTPLRSRSPGRRFFLPGCVQSGDRRVVGSGRPPSALSDHFRFRLQYSETQACAVSANSFASRVRGLCKGKSGPTHIEGRSEGPDGDAQMSKCPDREGIGDGDAEAGGHHLTDRQGRVQLHHPPLALHPRLIEQEIEAHAG